MKNFISKIVLFSILILMSFVFLYYKRPSRLVERFTNHEFKYEIINLGNSHGANIAYGDRHGQSFQRAGNTLFYDLQNYRYLKDHLTEEAVVIIPVAYFTFGLDENRTDYKDPGAFVNEYYLYLPSSSIYDYSFKKNIQVYLNKAKANYLSIVNERFFKEEKKIKNTLSIESSLEKHADKRVPSHLKMGTYSNPEKNIKYLIELIKDIRNNGHQAVLLTMPFSRFYNERFSENWLNKHYYSYLNDVVKTTKVPYLNYSNDERISPKDSLFSNSDHLNQKGRLLFSDILFEDLRTLQVFN